MAFPQDFPACYSADLVQTAHSPKSVPPPPPISTQNSIDLSEIMEAREGRRATMISSQLEPDEWHLRMEGEPMADPILSRIATSVFSQAWLSAWGCGGNPGPKPSYATSPKSLRYCMGLL